MKKNHISEGTTKFLYMSVEIFIACMVIGFIIHMAISASDLGKTSSSKLDDFNKELVESEITKYDGLEVEGSDVVNFIKKHLGKYSSSEDGPFTVYIETINGTTMHTNNEFIEKTMNFTDNYYIKPTSKFLGSVERNANDVIIAVKFKRQ